MAGGGELNLLACRFAFAASRTYQPGRAGFANDLRGALGRLLPERFFRPIASAGPSGFRTPPSPFVLRARVDLAGAIHLFNADAEPMVHAAMRQIQEGLGRGRAPLTLIEWVVEPVSLSLAPLPAPSRVRVNFRTVTELKGWTDESAPPFQVLLSRLRDRISALRSLYGSGPLEIDFRAVAERAALIETVASDLYWHAAERRSTRTGQVHPLSGFRGWVDYTGELSEFLPFLRAGYWTGVGRQTVWGKGEITVE